MKKVDDKWSWISCGACFWTLFFIQGTARSTGLFYACTIEEWHVNRVEAAWPFNLLAALEGVGIFLCGMCQQRNVVRRGAILAVILFCAAFGLSSLTRDNSFLIILIGIIGGLCHGYVVAASLICICHSFTDYRNTALGLAVCGSSLGGIVLPYLHSYIIDVYSLGPAYQLVAGISLQAAITAALCRFVAVLKSERKPLNKSVGETENLRSADIETEERDVSKTIEIPSTKQKNNVISAKVRKFFQKALGNFKGKLVLLKHPVLHIYTTSFTIVIFCAWFWYIIIIDVGKDKGFSQDVATGFISSLSVGGLIGRFSFGWIIDFGLIKRKTGFIILFGAMSLINFLTPHLFNVFALVTLSGLFGLSAGAIASTRGSVPASYFGTKEMSFALGLNGMMCSVTSLLRPWFIGYFREGKGSYDAMFYTMGGLSCFASVLWLMEPLAMKLHKRNQEIQNGDISI